jgi:tRNA (guanine26-N2/guanine27-N2)-dimethyltransferase
MMEFREGTALIKVPEFEKITSRTKVFYNPAMEFDRALSLQIFLASGKKKVLDAFSGSGIRAILYALEGAEVTASDRNRYAVELIKKNAALNSVSLQIMHEDATLVMRGEKFEVIDIDPFGSPTLYLDSAMCGLHHDSFLFVTATDTEAACGFAPRAALRKYGVHIQRTSFAKELGIRVLLTAIMREGAKHRFGFSVLLSYWRMHYLRVFVRALRSKKAAVTTMNQVIPIYVCTCGYVSTTSVLSCPSCGTPITVFSPLYMGPIKDNDFLNSIEDNPLIHRVREELDVPLYHDTHHLSKVYGFLPPKINSVIAAMRDEGFSASRTIFCPTGIKTTADFATVLRFCKGR